MDIFVSFLNFHPKSIPGKVGGGRAESPPIGVVAKDSGGLAPPPRLPLPGRGWGEAGTGEGWGAGQQRCSGVGSQAEAGGREGSCPCAVTFVQ